jgi:hypothetical protein
MIIGITMQQASGAAPPPHLHNGHIREGKDEEDVAQSYEAAKQMHVIHGGTVGQPVYAEYMQDPSVNMIALGGQYHASQAQPEDHSSSQNSYAQYMGDVSDNVNDNDGEDGEDDPVKLFVGQVRVLVLSAIVDSDVTDVTMAVCG